jgi:hypothetical protein
MNETKNETKGAPRRLFVADGLCRAGAAYPAWLLTRWGLKGLPLSCDL